MIIVCYFKSINKLELLNLSWNLEDSYRSCDKQNSNQSFWDGDKEECWQKCAYIWTYEIGEINKNKPTIILVHGFGGASLSFFKVLKELSENYHIILFDLPGFGRSSRPSQIFETAEEWEDFFIESIEWWRRRLNLNDMVVWGYSFGGYIIGRYADKYPTNIKKIIFHSTHGIFTWNDNRDEAIRKFLSKEDFIITVNLF